MDESTVTLIAAVASAVTAVVVGVQASAAERRNAHRALLNPAVEAIGRTLHEIVAQIQTATNARDDSRLRWIQRAQSSADELKDLRIQARYSLWGLDEGLRTMTRLPDWASHLIDSPESLQLLASDATQLKTLLDEAIRKAHSSGEPPSESESKAVADAAERVRNRRAAIMEVDRGRRA